MNGDGERPELKRRTRSRGRPKLEDYTSPDQLTPKMVEFANGLAAGLPPAQVGLQMGFGVQQIEAWNNCIGIQEKVKELQFERSLKDQVDVWEEMSAEFRDLFRYVLGFMKTKFAKGEVPWATAVEIMKFLVVMGGAKSPPSTSTIEATETETIRMTTIEMLKASDASDLEIEQFERGMIDPEFMPAGLAGGGKKVKKVKSKKLKVIKPEKEDKKDNNK
jgi:hypothetical protein